MKEPLSENILDREQEVLWELFHANSKQTRLGLHASEQEIMARMAQIEESLNFADHPVIDLKPHVTPLDVRLGDVLMQRFSSRNISDRPLSLAQCASVLWYSYGTNGRTVAPDVPRKLRTVPSAGALYPIDLFFYANNVDELERGVYHFSPLKQGLHPVIMTDVKASIADTLVQKEEFAEVPMLLFLVASFDRTVFKYGDRGYRFVHLDAGHIAQNVNLVAMGLGLSSCNIGGYYDTALDDVLLLDGLSQSVLYVIAIGHEKAKNWDSEE